MLRIIILHTWAIKSKTSVNVIENGWDKCQSTWQTSLRWIRIIRLFGIPMCKTIHIPISKVVKIYKIIAYLGTGPWIILNNRIVSLYYYLLFKTTKVLNNCTSFTYMLLVIILQRFLPFLFDQLLMNVNALLAFLVVAWRGECTPTACGILLEPYSRRTPMRSVNCLTSGK